MSKGNTLSDLHFQKKKPTEVLLRTTVVQGTGIKAGRPDRGCSEFHVTGGSGLSMVGKQGSDSKDNAKLCLSSHLHFIFWNVITIFT